ncbi:MAG: GNAT family N-acetyltransferase [Polyangiaceae bacterium]
MLAPATDLELRVARPDEFALILEIDNDSCRLYERFGVDLGITDEHPFALAERARWRSSVERGAVFIARSRSTNEDVGFAACGFTDGAPYLDQLSVRLAAMQRGAGSLLIERSVSWARELGGADIWLTTYNHLPFNRPMYERRGFVVAPASEWGPDLAHHVDEQRRALPLPDERVVMRRRTSA